MHILVTLSSSHSEATSFQRYKWPITKMYTTSTVFLAYNVSCHFTRCIPFCSKPNKPLFAWWKFYDSQSEAPIQMVFKATLKWITPLIRVSCEANCMLCEVTFCFGKMWKHILHIHNSRYPHKK